MPVDDSDDEYGLVGWDKHGPVKENADRVELDASRRRSRVIEDEEEDEEIHVSGEAEQSEGDDLLPPRRPRPVLPASPFLSGTFSFPLQRSSLLRFFLLALGAIGLSRLALGSIEMGKSGSLAGWVGSAAFMVCGSLLGLAWFCYASACALAVTRDTASGCDKVDAWPALDVLDYFGDMLYLFNALCVSVLPGFALGWLSLGGGAMRGFVTVVAGFALFPIVLLSMLESGTPLGVASLPVWRTFAVAADGWIRFYGAAAALLATVAVVVKVAFLFGSMTGTIVAATVFAAAWLIYFRLLGRLSWYCSERMALFAPDEEEPDDEELEDLELHDDDAGGSDPATMAAATFAFCPRCATRVEVGQVRIGEVIACLDCGHRFSVRR